jgi:peroxin-19
MTLADIFLSLQPIPVRTFSNQLTPGPQGFRDQLEKLARLAGGLAGKEDETVLDPEGSLKEMMQQISADTERLGEGLTEADLSAMFQHLQADGGSGPEDLDQLIPMMEGMMRSLLSKDLLYPAIKDMNDKFPDWLADHRAGLSAEDFERYNKQYEKTRLICQEFEEEEATASQAEKSARFQRVMLLMQVRFFCRYTTVRRG